MHGGSNIKTVMSWRERLGLFVTVITYISIHLELLKVDFFLILEIALGDNSKSERWKCRLSRINKL
jgi:hypothetical protein